MQRVTIGILLVLVVFGGSFTLLYIISRPVADLLSATATMVNVACVSISLVVAALVAGAFFRG